MSSVADRQLADACARVGRSSAEIHAWRDAKLDRVWIKAFPESGCFDEADRFASFEIAVGGRGDSIATLNFTEAWRPNFDGGCVSLNISTELLEKAGGVALIEAPSGRRVVDPIAFELAHAIVEACSQACSNDYTKRCLVTMLCTQLCETVQASALPRRRRRASFDHWQREILEAALSDLCERDTSLESFASRCGLSVCHFARIFKASYGMPFHQYVVQNKIARACALLEEGQESISQIALACGFSDQSSFTRRFSAKTGASPAVWQKSPSMHMAGSHGSDSALALTLGRN